MSSFIRERLYYEIAMSIGNSLDLDIMLKEGLSTYLRKLNCLAGAVLEQVEEEGSSSFQLAYAIPKRMKHNSAVSYGIETLPTGLEKDDLSDFLSRLPEIGSTDGLMRYLMELPGYGLLLLVKSAPGFSRPELKSLAPLNVKLAGSCISCRANGRLQAEIREREQAEERFRAIFHNAVEGIFQASVEGQFIVVNPAMARILGYDSPSEVVEQKIDSSKQLYVNDEARKRLMRKLKRVGKVSGFEFEYYRRDRSVGWLSVSARLIRNEDGRDIRIEGSADDITPRKQAVIALREAKKEAERLSQMKSNFLSMVSHELRTPLTAILGFAKITLKRLGEILGAETGCSPKVVKGLVRLSTNTEVVIAEAERLTELINNVLDLAKLEAGWFEWKDSDVSMNRVLDHSLAATEVLFRDTPVTLSHAIEDDLSVISGDNDRMVQVVINLVSNAAKFTAEGSVTVTATESDDWITVSVVDTGRGVAKEDRAIIFDKFRQLGDTLTDKPKGTGLGLPICKEILEHHRGRIWVEPNPGGGSIFAFTLPVKR